MFRRPLRCRPDTQSRQLSTAPHLLLLLRLQLGFVDVHFDQEAITRPDFIRNLHDANPAARVKQVFSMVFECGVRQHGVGQHSVRQHGVKHGAVRIEHGREGTHLDLDLLVARRRDHTAARARMSYRPVKIHWLALLQAAAVAADAAARGKIGWGGVCVWGVCVCVCVCVCLCGGGGS